MMRRVRPRVSGRLIVVGGQCSGVGKTALVVDLIRAMRGEKWTAVKITPHGGESGEGGEEGGAVPERHTFAIREETDARGRTDTSRFLAAGAERALWVKTKAGRMGDALVALEKELAGAGNVIVESDGIVRWWKPDLYLMVVDPREGDFKESARRGVREADVFVSRAAIRRMGAGRRAARRKEWAIIAARRKGERCRVLHRLGEALPQKLQRIVRQPWRRG